MGNSFKLVFNSKVTMSYEGYFLLLYSTVKLCYAFLIINLKPQKSQLLFRVLSYCCIYSYVE